MRFTSSLILAYASYAAYTAATSTVVATVSQMAGTSTIAANGAAATGTIGNTGSDLGSGSGTSSGIGVDTGSGTGPGTGPGTSISTGGDASMPPTGADGTGPPADWQPPDSQWGRGRWGGWRGMHPHMPRGWTDWFGGGAATKDKYTGQPQRRHKGNLQGMPASGSYPGSVQSEGQDQGDALGGHSHQQRGAGSSAGYGAPAQVGSIEGQGQNYGGKWHRPRSEGGHSHVGFSPNKGTANYGESLGQESSHGQDQAARSPAMRRDVVSSGPSWNDMLSGKVGPIQKRSIPYATDGWVSSQGQSQSQGFNNGPDPSVGSSRGNWMDHGSHDQKRDDSGQGRPYSGPAWFQRGVSS